jgi:hypothetical protein
MQSHHDRLHSMSVATSARGWDRFTRFVRCAKLRGPRGPVPSNSVGVVIGDQDQRRFASNLAHHLRSHIRRILGAPANMSSTCEGSMPIPVSATITAAPLLRSGHARQSPAGRRVLDCVIQQFGKHLPQPHGVRSEHDRSRVACDGQHGAHTLQCALTTSVNLKGSLRRTRRPRGQARDVEQVVEPDLLDGGFAG